MLNAQQVDDLKLNSKLTVDQLLKYEKYPTEI